MEAFPAKATGESAARVSRRVTVTTTARLHFGFLDPGGRSAQPFGSFGLSLDRPRTRLTLTRSRGVEIAGPESERAERYLRTIAGRCGVDQNYALRIAEAIPPHAGLGSGTQLALAVGSAFAAVEGVALSPQEIAKRLARGARSGIGIATFEAGGLVLDSGPIGGALPQLTNRHLFPPDWRVLLIFDPEAQGLAGAGETAAFETLTEFPPGETAALRERVTNGALPAAAAGDFERFCREIDYLQERMGAYFAPLQGGPYTSPRVEAALGWLRGQGIQGLGQSSWGPTGFAFFASEGEGRALRDLARSLPRHEALRFDLAGGRNRGAEIEANSSEVR